MFRLFKKSKIRVSDIVLAYADKCRGSKAYISRIRNVAAEIKQYEKVRDKKLFASDFTENVILDFRDFLRGKKLLENTINKKISIIFTCLRNSKSRHCLDFEKISLRNDEPYTVYLSLEELQRLSEIKLSKTDDAVRNLFIVGCCTGMRYSDYSKLTDKNIVEDTIVRKTKKTGADVIIPIHSYVREIIKKQGGLSAYTGTQQNFNNRIKKICQKAKINEYVLVERIRGGIIETKRIRKYNLVSSHTARRSFATNAYLSGIPVARIMLCAGHKTESAFFKYIRIQKQENAMILSDHPFFRLLPGPKKT